MAATPLASSSSPPCAPPSSSPTVVSLPTRAPLAPPPAATNSGARSCFPLILDLQPPSKPGSHDHLPSIPSPPVPLNLDANDSSIGSTSLFIPSSCQSRRNSTTHRRPCLLARAPRPPPPSTASANSSSPLSLRARPKQLLAGASSGQSRGPTTTLQPPLLPTRAQPPRPALRAHPLPPSPPAQPRAAPHQRPASPIPYLLLRAYLLLRSPASPSSSSTTAPTTIRAADLLPLRQPQPPSVPPQSPVAPTPLELSLLVFLRQRVHSPPLSATTHQPSSPATPTPSIINGRNSRPPVSQRRRKLLFPPLTNTKCSLERNIASVTYVEDLPTQPQDYEVRDEA